MHTTDADRGGRRGAFFAAGGNFNRHAVACAGQFELLTDLKEAVFIQIVDLRQLLPTDILADGNRQQSVAGFYGVGGRRRCAFLRKPGAFIAALCRRRGGACPRCACHCGGSRGFGFIIRRSFCLSL